MTREKDVAPTPEEGEAGEPIPEPGTFESPTSNDVGEQTKTQADEAEEGEAEA